MVEITSKQLCVRAAFRKRTLHLTTNFDMETKLDNTTEPQHDAKRMLCGRAFVKRIIKFEEWK